MKLTKLFGTLLFVIAFGGNVMGQTYKLANVDNNITIKSDFESYCGDGKYIAKLKTNGVDDWRKISISDGNSIIEPTMINPVKSSYGSRTEFFINGNDTYYLVYDPATNSVSASTTAPCEKPYVEDLTATYAIEQGQNGNGLTASSFERRICNDSPVQICEIYSNGDQDWQGFRFKINGNVISPNDFDKITGLKKGNENRLYTGKQGKFYIVYDPKTNSIRVCDINEDPCYIPPVLDYTVRPTYNESDIKSEICEKCSSDVFIIQINGDNFHNGFCLYDSNNKRFNITGYKLSDIIQVVTNGDVYGLKLSNNSSTINGWIRLDIKSKTLEYFTSNNKPSCGPQKPVIPTINDVCIESVASLSEPTVTWGQSESQAFWSKDGTTSFTPSSSTLNIGDEFYYVAIDANGADHVLSNKIKVIGIPSISPIDNISYCAADGGYDLSKHIVTDNGATTTVIWKLNGSTIDNSSKPTLNAGDVLSVEATNACGTTTPAPMNVSNACLPKIETIQAIEPICGGEKITLPEPIINYYEEVDGDYGWEIYTGSEWVSFDESESLSNEEYNGKKIRVKACNTIDCSTSNEVTLTVKPNTPEFTVSVSGNSVMEPLGGSSSSVTYTVTKENECNSDDLEVTLSDDNFGYSIDGNKVIVFLKDDTELGTYETKVKFDIGSESKEESLTGLVAEYPKTFILKKICGGAESDYPVTTDENGKLNIQLHSDDNCEYVNEGTIECTEFTLTTSASDHFSGKFVNKGTIKADKIYYGTSSKKLGGSDAVYFDCGGTFIANDLEMNFNTITTSLKGIFLIYNTFKIAPAQGQNFEIAKCTEIKTYSTDIGISGGSMEISIHGHLNTEYFDVNIPNITSYEDAVITIGHLENPNLNLVISETSLLNLCHNPNKGKSDDIGYIYGTLMYLSDETTGWVDDNTPITEGDLNKTGTNEYYTIAGRYGSPIIPKAIIPAYKSYKDCIEEKGMSSFLGIDDDPFLPKDKEIRNLYNCNPCSKDFEDTKIKLREIHGRTFRLINGEFIYCENDNDY